MSTTIQKKLNEVKIKQAATSDIASGDHEAEEYRRGRGDGIAWAREYATANELRDLVENFEPGRGGDIDMDHSPCDLTSDKEQMNAVSVSQYDSPHWRGFVAGAEDVLLNG
jgi:hypothetical protein